MMLATTIAICNTNAAMQKKIHWSEGNLANRMFLKGSISKKIIAGISLT